MQCKILKILNLQFVHKRCYKKSSVRVRFAPSPTGHLHLGGLRTALYNYLFARKHGGSFLLRIEDTDQTRLIPGAMEKLHENLIWSGIIPDEDPVRGGPRGPYVQSKRLHFYEEYVLKLLNNNSAYYCFCTEHRLDLLRREALKMRSVPKYDNRCRHLKLEEITSKVNKGEAHCIRFKLSPEPQSYQDLVYGNLTSTAHEGDPVIMKTDGYPTYHFANVVDDHLMEITHVLRGVEWQGSTTKHIEIYKAFGWKPPQFAHLPLILNSDGSKLSKRQGDITIESYKKDGIFPLALINYITHSGGGFNRSPGALTSYSYKELIEQFNLSRINAYSSKLKPEDLLEFNRLEINHLLTDRNNSKFLVHRVQNLIVEAFPDRANDGSLQLDEEYILTILNWANNRMTKLKDLVSKELAFLWIMPNKQSIIVDPNLRELIQVINRELAAMNISDFNRTVLNNYLKEFSISNGIKYPQLMKAMRCLLCGLGDGPPVAEMIEILGKDKALDRLNRI